MAKKAKTTKKKAAPKKAVTRSKTKTKKTAKKKPAAKKATKKKTAVKKAAKKKTAVKKKTKKKAAVRKTAKKKTTKKKITKKKPATKKTTRKRTTTKRAASGSKSKTGRKTPMGKIGKKIGSMKTRTATRGRARRLTKQEIEGYRRLLLEKRAELVGDVNYIESEALRKSRLDAAGDLSSMPIHMADIGTDNFEQEFSLGLMDSERKILVEITAALGRIELGTFGICEGTGLPISKARLNASPWARYCIKYAMMVEQGLVVEGEKIIEEEPEDVSGDSGEYEIVDDEDYDEVETHDLEDTQYGLHSHNDDI